MSRNLLMVCLLAMGCGKAEVTKDAPRTEPSATPTASVPAVASSSPVVATASAAPVPTPSAVVSVATPPRTGTAMATASATVAAPPLPPGVGMHFDGNHFAVDVATPLACDKGTECKLPVRLSAKDEFHVNKEYPYKVKMDDASGAEFLGTDAQGKSTFSKSAGDFAFDGEKAGVITVRFKPSAPGALAMTGTMKLSVCNASNCMLETAQVHATVPVR